MKNHIKTKGNQTFNVPNTDEGKFFVTLCSKFMNQGFEKSVRGRAKNRSKAFKKAKNPNGNRYNCQSHVPRAGADWLAVYVRPVPEYKKIAKQKMAAWKKQQREAKNPPLWNYQKA